MKSIVSVISLILFCQTFGIAQVTISADSLKKHVYTLADDSFEGRSIGTKGGDKAAHYIADQFKAIGIKPLLSDYFQPFVYKSQALSAEGKNVIGIIEGSDPVLKNEYIIIGGHYDHVGYYFKGDKKIVYNGADDNASGVSGVIETGREIFKNRAQFKRSIILIAFDGEETGLNGSTQFVKDSIVPLSQIKLMLSLDMIGMLSKNKGIELYGTGSFANARTIMEQVAANQNLPIKKEEKGVANRTDTKPFGEAGIPAIHVFTGTVSPYHKPEDDANLLDYQGMGTITGFIYEFTLKMANTDTEQLASNLTTADKPKLLNVGVRVNAGTSYHDYPDEFYRSKSGFALQTGLYAHINLTKRFALQPEVLYETLGTKHTDGNFRTHAITTPVNILVRLAGVQEVDMWSYLLVGGYYSHNFAGKAGSADIDYTTLYNPDDYGVNLGLVLNIYRIQIGVTHKVGLTNLYQGTTNDNIKNNALFFTMGVQF